VLADRLGIAPGSRPRLVKGTGQIVLDGPLDIGRSIFVSRVGLLHALASASGRVPFAAAEAIIQPARRMV
ncbi:hypothetical protein, partial [Enterobacter hormaechei]|uniref:hypothetical protein n=1 Tax=Enterobacter hormaechei TaxID=158836 RepID=UPI0019545EF7